MHPAVFEIVAFTFIVIFVVTHWVVPALTGKPSVFSFKEAAREVDEAEIELTAAQLRAKAATRRREAESVRKATNYMEHTHTEGSVGPNPPKEEK